MNVSRALRQRVAAPAAAPVVPNIPGAPPTSPPVQFSGADAALLQGPATAPAGAVTVTPGQSIYSLTQSNPAGTTFYLLGGTHYPNGTAGNGQFDQIQPKSGNTYIGAPGAVLDGRNVNAYAFTGSASNVTIKYLEVTRFACGINEFTVNHDSASGWTIQFCNMHHNQGCAIGTGSGELIDSCWLHHNQQYGFSSYKAPVNGAAAAAIVGVTINRCEISYNGDHTLEYNPDGTPTGAGLSGAGKFWDTQDIVFTGNWIHHSLHVGLWCDTNNLVATITGNLFEDNDAEAIFYEISWNFRIANNMIRRNAIFKGKNWASRQDNFPIAAIYISESGGDSTVASTHATSLIDGNAFVDNWGDITLWESADRFCNSPANTSGKIWKPRSATLAICNVPTAKTLTVTTTSGSTAFTVTGGTFESTDEGRPASGTGIPAGAKIAEPLTMSGPNGYADATHGVLTVAATASGSRTLTLAAGTINTEPAYSNCRWRTMNVHVQNNTHSHTVANVLAGYTLPSGVVTGKIALLSQFGTYPSWSPYQGTVVQVAISSTQNNVWATNTYTGGVKFMVRDTGNMVSFASWKSTYTQDAGSTLT